MGARARNRLLLIFSMRIFDSSVERGSPSRAAAPDGPATRPPLARRASSTIAFSCAANVPDKPSRLSTAAAPESQLPSTVNSSVSDIGPIITRDAVKLIDDRVKDALARGAKAHTGAKHDGQIYYPTILTDVPLDAAIANEETFGPVVVVEVVDTPDEAIAAANRTMYGLTSSILAGNTYKAFEMAPKVLAGIVNVNSPTVNDEIHAPMGGVRDSGWGRTGPRSLDDFSDVIWINSHSGQRQYPF